MNGNKGATRLVKQNVFRAVAVMNIEIKDSDPFAPCSTRFERGDGDGVEITKAHGLFPRGVMAWRTHQAEGRLARSG